MNSTRHVHNILDVRWIATLLAAILTACRTAPREKCFPERGIEVWQESRYPAPSARFDALARLTSIKLEPSVSTPVVPGANVGGRQGRVLFIGPKGAVRPDTILTSVSTVDGRIAGMRELRPGIYRVRVRDIGWVDAVRDVELRAGERMDLVIQTRESAACLMPVVITS